MNKTVVILAALIIAGALAGIAVYFSSNRFYMVSGSRGEAYEIDRKTGKTWVLIGDEKIPHKGTSDTGNKQEFKSFPAEELRKVTGAGTFDRYGLKLEGKLYNGSGWHAREVTITISAKNRDGTIRWTRQYNGDFHAEPLTAGYINISVVDAAEATCVSRIDDVRGYPQP